MSQKRKTIVNRAFRGVCPRKEVCSPLYNPVVAALWRR